MPIDSAAFKDAMRHFAAGVNIVTVKAGEQTHGLTASAFVSVSAEPPLIAVVINHSGRAYPLFESSDAVFAVNMLRENQQELSDRFAWKEDRFALGNWTTAETGAPVLADAIGWMDCTVYSRLSAGSHTLYVGEVQASSVIEPDANPLVYWNRGYRAVADIAVPEAE